VAALQHGRQAAGQLQRLRGLAPEQLEAREGGEVAQVAQRVQVGAALDAQVAQEGAVRGEVREIEEVAGGEGERGEGGGARPAGRHLRCAFGEDIRNYMAGDVGLAHVWASWNLSCTIMGYTPSIHRSISP
jgi:hypothetical protein